MSPTHDTKTAMLDRDDEPVDEPYVAAGRRTNAKALAALLRESAPPGSPRAQVQKRIVAQAELVAWQRTRMRR